MERINELIAKQRANLEPATTSPSSLSLTPSPETDQSECPTCLGLGFLRVDAPVGTQEFGKIIPCPGPAHQHERIEQMAKVSGLHQGDMTRRLADIKEVNGNETMLVAARELIKNPYGWLYIWGGPGNAKSEVLIAIVNEINHTNQGPALYTKLSQVIEFMRDAYTERQQNGNIDGSYSERFDKLKAIKVLAIDEMDKVRDTPFVQDFRFDFLDERYRQAIHGETVTVFAGNSDPVDFPAPIYDRLRDGHFKIVNNTAGSARPNMKQQQPADWVK